MDHHVLYDKTTRLKMTARMLINKLMGSRKRLVASLILAIVLVDVCIISSPRAHPSPAAAEEAAAQAGRRQVQEAGQALPQPPAPAWTIPSGQKTQARPVRQLPDQPAAWGSFNEVGVDAEEGDEKPVKRPVHVVTKVVTITRRRLELEAGENNVDIKLDGASLMVRDINNRTRGLHMLVLHQGTGGVMARRRFDTVLGEVHVEAAKFLDAVRPGRIIVMATKDDMSYKMHSDLRQQLTQMGSQFIPDLGFRDQWAMVTVQGSGEALGESFSAAPASGEFGGPLFLRVDLSLGAYPATPSCGWPDTEESRRRRDFCDRYEGYPGVCRCLQPHVLVPEPTTLEESTESIYVAVMATHRPYYLYRTLRSLAFARGVIPENVMVYLENDRNPELEALVGLLGFTVRYVPTRSSSRIHLVIGNRVMDILDDVFTTFMEAGYVLFLEEDLESSPDIFRYFGRTHKLLEMDPTLLSISAFNQLSSINTSYATDAAYRVDAFSGSGFLLRRETYERDVKPIWPEHAWKDEWDFFMDKVVRKERENIVPDVNRVYHIGRDSQFINTDLFDNYYKNMSVNPDPAASLKAVTRLQKQNYEEDLKSTLEGGTFIRDYKLICNVGNMTTNFLSQNVTEILFFEMEHQYDKSTWRHLSKCWGLWPFISVANHGGLWRFWLRNGKGLLYHVIFIGVPYSRYSSFRPADLVPFRAPGANNTLGLSGTVPSGQPSISSPEPPAVGLQASSDRAQPSSSSPSPNGLLQRLQPTPAVNTAGKPTASVR